MAASLRRFSKSAPEYPIVFFAIISRSTPCSNFLFFAWTAKICLRPSKSGICITTVRSNLPGRSIAGSSTSGRLVAAKIMTFFFSSRPSISTKIWFNVCSVFAEEFRLVPLLRATASISSINMMHGATLFAFLKRSLTRLAPAPTSISSNSEPLVSKKGTPASPATALASNVLPVPGAPTSKTPFGILAPISKYFCGFFKKSTTSVTSSLASSMPATSPNVTPTLLPNNILALLSPNPVRLLPDDCIPCISI